MGKAANQRRGVEVLNDRDPERFHVVFSPKKDPNSITKALKTQSDVHGSREFGQLETGGECGWGGRKEVLMVFCVLPFV